MIKTTKIIIICFLFFTFIRAISLSNADGAIQNLQKDLGGTYEYSTFFEAGSKAGTWTKKPNRVTVTHIEGEYQLSWGSLKVKVTRIANGLIYKWKSGNAFGEGIYLFYENNKKLFGSFRLTDKNGEHRGYTQGEKIE